MHASRTSHLNVVKRIFKYLQGTIDHGLLFKANGRLDLMVASFDVDWVGYRDTSYALLGLLSSLDLTLSFGILGSNL